MGYEIYTVYEIHMIMQEPVKTKRMAAHTAHVAGAWENTAYMRPAVESHRLRVSTDQGRDPPEEDMPWRTKKNVDVFFSYAA